MEARSDPADAPRALVRGELPMLPAILADQSRWPHISKELGKVDAAWEAQRAKERADARGNAAGLRCRRC